MKHTPGPWMYMHEIQKVDEKFELHFHTVRTGDKNIVRVPSEFDARLIAASPDMLDLLLFFWVNYVHFGPIDADTQKRFKNLIESATGQKIDDILQATGHEGGK